MVPVGIIEQATRPAIQLCRRPTSLGSSADDKNEQTKHSHKRTKHSSGAKSANLQSLLPLFTALSPNKTIKETEAWTADLDREHTLHDRLVVM